MQDQNEISAGGSGSADDIVAGDGPGMGGLRGTERHLSRDDIFTTLSNRRRRRIIDYLNRTPDLTVAVQELYNSIAATENEVALGETTYNQRKRVYTSLVQTHLPKLAELGVVEYDADRGTVSLREESKDLDVYLEVNRGSDILRSDYYIGLSILSSLMVVTLAFAVPPFSAIPDLTWFAAASVLFLVSSVVHGWQTRRSHLGTVTWPMGRTQN